MWKERVPERRGGKWRRIGIGVVWKDGKEEVGQSVYLLETRLVGWIRANAMCNDADPKAWRARRGRGPPGGRPLLVIDYRIR